MRSLRLIALFFLLVPWMAQAADNAVAAFNPVIVLDDAGQESDKSFTDSARRGANLAAENLKIKYREYLLSDTDDREQLLHSAIQAGATDVIAVGFQNVVPVMKLAELYPKVRFTVVDGIVPPLFTNVQSIIFRDHEGAFLVGMVAAFVTKTERIGFIGGMDVPLIRNFAYGYAQGAKYAKPEVKVFTDMIGDTRHAWQNPEKAAELAKKQFDQGVDIIFAAAGGSGLGVLKTAHEKQKLAIGVDINQNNIYPGSVLTSMVKRVDKAVYEAIETGHNGAWKPGIKYLGVKENALDFAVDANNKQLITKDIIEKVEATKDLIIRGVINVEVYSPN